MSSNKEVKTTHVGLRPGTDYIARVRTFDKLGNPSGWANAQTFTTPELEGAYIPEHEGTHEAPTNFSMEAGYKAFLAQWDPDLAEDMKYGFGRYVIEVTWIDNADDEHTDEHTLSDTDFFEDGGVYKYLYSNDEIKPGSDVTARVKVLDPHDNESEYSIEDTETTELIYTHDLIDPMIIPHGKALQAASWNGTLALENDATRGWRLEADGNANFYNAILRGDLLVKTLRTTNDPWTEGGFYIESTLADETTLGGGNNVIYFMHPELDPPWPAQVGSHYYAYNPSFPDSPEAQHIYMHPWLGDDSEGLGEPKLWLTVENPSGEEAHPFRTYARLTADEIQVNGITIVKPPLGIFSGNGTSVTSSGVGGEQTLDLRTEILRNTALDGTHYMGFTSGSGSPYVRPLIPGYYRIDMTVSALGPDEYYAYFGVNIGPLSPVSDANTEILIGGPFFGGPIGSSQSVGGTFYFDGSQYLRIRALQGSGSTQTLQIQRLEVKFASLD